MDDRQFKRLLDVLGYRYEGYRRVRKGVKKRLRRHMRELGCRDVSAYLERIAASSAARDACILQMTVPISRFMRDWAFWEALRDVWLPGLRQVFGPDLRAWSAGCACGEEAHSLAIIDRESDARPTAAVAPRLRIVASDLNPACLEKARSGVYPASSLRETPPELTALYFTALRGGRRYRIDASLGKTITWECGAIEGRRPAPCYHLILLRNNVLTYCDIGRHKRLLANVVGQLYGGGLLVVGLGESVPDRPGLEPASDGFPYVFRKNSGA